MRVNVWHGLCSIDIYTPSCMCAPLPLIRWRWAWASRRTIGAPSNRRCALWWTRTALQSVRCAFCQSVCHTHYWSVARDLLQCFGVILNSFGWSIVFNKFLVSNFINQTYSKCDADLFRRRRHQANGVSPFPPAALFRSFTRFAVFKFVELYFHLHI